MRTTFLAKCREVVGGGVAQNEEYKKLLASLISAGRTMIEMSTKKCTIASDASALVVAPFVMMVQMPRNFMIKMWRFDGKVRF